MTWWMARQARQRGVAWRGDQAMGCYGCGGSGLCGCVGGRRSGLCGCVGGRRSESVDRVCVAVLVDVDLRV